MNRPTPPADPPGRPSARSAGAWRDVLASPRLDPRGWWRAVRAVPASRWRRGAALVVVALLAAGTFGVTTASVQASLGPHLARYDVTTDATVTIDLGPLGTLQIDSPLPLTLGVRATVQEIPADLTELTQATTLQALSGDLAAYLQFFSGPEAAVQDVAIALAQDAALRTGLALLVLVGAGLGLGALLGGARRRDLRAAVHARRRAIAGGTAVVLAGATVLTSSLAPDDRPTVTRTTSAVFDGTPLAGARVTGRLGGVIDTYGGYAVDVWRQNEQFYQAADDALVVAWGSWQAEQDALVQGATGDGATPGATAGAGSDAVGPTFAASLEPTGSPTAAAAPPTATATPTEGPVVDPVVLVLVSDLHCNVGMAQVMGTLATLAEADAVIDAGDTTMNGTSVEQYCVTSFARAVPAGVPLVTSPGNHDSAETSRVYARAGATVLDGSVVEVAGLRLLGDSDPNETRIGGGTSTAAEESAPEAGRRLAEVACDDGDVDLLVIHTPTVGDQALEDGCVPAQVSGHYHRRVGPEPVGAGVRYISSSTAGATLGQPTVGPLRGVATLTVLRADRETGALLDLQVVEVTPQATVTVRDREPWPPLPEPVEEDGASADPTDDPTAGATAETTGGPTPRPTGTGGTGGG